MRLMRRPKKTAVDVIHYRDMQEALESSQSILETGAYAVELTDKMILDLARGQHRAVAAHGLRPGRPGRHHDRRVRRRHRRRGARQGRGAGGPAPARASSATPPRGATTRTKQARSGRCARPASACCSAMKGDEKPIAFVEDTAVEPQHLAGVRAAASARSSPSTTPRAPTTATARSAACTSARSSTCKTPRGLEQVRPIADEITDLVLEFGGAIAQRARRRPRPQPVPASEIFGPTLYPGLPRAQAAFDPEEPHESRQDRGRAAGMTENLRYGAEYRTCGAEDAARLLRAGRVRRRRRDVQRRRRLPQEARGDHVPLVHGHAGRGALHARPRQRAARRLSGRGCPPRRSPASGCTR